MTEHIVALFEKESSAAAAAGDLEAAGIPRTAIRRYSAHQEGVSSLPAGNTRTQSRGGFWAWLLGDDYNQPTLAAYREDAEIYEQGAKAGKTVLGVVLHDDSQIHQAVTILENHEPIQISEATDENDPRLSGSAPSTVVAANTGVAATGATYSSSAATQPLSPSATTPPTAAAGQAAPEGDQVIPLAEEQIVVGTRTVERGTTRVRRYVVETPVEQDVTLRGERVTIERRQPVEALGVPPGAFEERVIEAHDTDEVPVVEKAARVVEEVTVRREATERTETVRDTVRREEIEIEGRDGTKPPAPKP